MTPLLLFVTPHPGWASSGDRGTASGVFLRLARTAREAALGNCGTGATGAAALGRNPAALGDAPGIVATRNQAAGGEISVDYAALALRPRGRFALGAAVLHATGGLIDQTDDTGERVGGFTPRDIAATIGASTRAGALSAGVTVSLLQSKIIHTAHAVTTGAGVEWRSSSRATRVGLYGAHLSGRLQYVDASAPLPRTARIGMSREIGRAMVVIEGVSPRDDGVYVAGGLEIHAGREPWVFALRTGFDGSRARSADGAAGLSAGAGLSSRGWSLDYAWAPGGDIGDGHLFTLGFRFRPSGASAPTEKPRR